MCFRKFMVSILVLFIMISFWEFPVEAKSKYVYSTNTFEIKNKEAKAIYDGLMKKNNDNESRGDDGKKLESQNFGEDDLVNFKKLVKISDGNSNFKSLYQYQDENVLDIIVYDESDNSYVGIEEDKVNNTAILYIDDEMYSICASGNDIWLESVAGDTINIYEEVLDSPSSEAPIVSSDVLIPNEDIYDVSVQSIVPEPTSSISWVLLGGPYHSTTKMVFECLQIIGTVAGMVTLSVSSPILGAVLVLYEVAVSVGATFKPTIHLKIYQYGASDCLSYIRQKKYYYGAYSESSGTWYEPIKTTSGALKYTYSYFHSIRPDYTGNPACLRY